jgi:hypothetical protein
MGRIAFGGRMRGYLSLLISIAKNSTQRRRGAKKALIEQNPLYFN